MHFISELHLYTNRSQRNKNKFIYRAMQMNNTHSQLQERRFKLRDSFFIRIKFQLSMWYLQKSSTNTQCYAKPLSAMYSLSNSTKNEFSKQTKFQHAMLRIYGNLQTVNETESNNCISLRLWKVTAKIGFLNEFCVI